MAVVLLAAGVLATVLISDGKVTDGVVTGVDAAPPTSTSADPTESIPALPIQPRSRNPAQVITPPDPAESLPALPTRSRNPAQIITPATPSSLQDTPEQLQQAITDYYALMPDNMPAAWKRLTANYQQNHSGGFTGYQNFWNPVQRVTVFDVSAKLDGTVDATIEYFFKDGRVIEERTSYRLVAEDGLWKIDSSTVRSSRTEQGS